MASEPTQRKEVSGSATVCFCNTVCLRKAEGCVLLDAVLFMRSGSTAHLVSRVGAVLSVDDVRVHSPVCVRELEKLHSVAHREPPKGVLAVSSGYRMETTVVATVVCVLLHHTYT